jgi:hypothetical protein
MTACVEANRRYQTKEKQTYDSLLKCCRDKRGERSSEG